MSGRTMLSLEEAAARLGTTVRHMRRLQRVIAFHHVGGKVRFDERDLDDYLERQRVEPEDPLRWEGRRWA